MLSKYNKPEETDTIIYYTYRYKDKEDNLKEYIYIVDDKSIPGDTLAKRRLALLKRGVKLRTLSSAIFFLGDLIKFANPQTWFIDSLGVVFQYRKSRAAKLSFRKITKVIPIETGGAILELEGLPMRFKTLFAPKPHEIYAGVLSEGASYILYGLYDDKYDSTRRSI